MEPGVVLDERFELLSAVRGGAIGDHWRARDLTTDDVVAIRIGKAASPALMRLVGQPVSGIVNVLAAGTCDGTAYVALELLSGGTLHDRLADAGITQRRAVEIAVAVARSIAALHALGVVHGGVDAKRCILDEDGNAVLLEPSAGTDDLNGLGALVYFALTGCEPGRTPDRRGAPSLPAPLIDLVGELLVKNPDASAAAVVGRLETLTGLDDSYPTRIASGRPVAEETADLRGESAAKPAWLKKLSIGHEDTAAIGAVPPVATPDLDRAAEDTTSLVVKPTDRYQLKEVVGQGGLGRVVLAHDRELNRPVAIKELLRRTPSSVARFRREALVTARLQHPAIVPIHDAGRWPNGAPYYAMKLVEGEDLSARIRATTTLAERLALLPKLITVCEAMAYAHAQRVIHRDLKPSNVVIGEFGEAMIVDWGLAKDLDGNEAGGDDATHDIYRAGGADDLTREGDVLGTPAYMSPEQAKGEPVDERTDVYALGAMLYHLLVGRAPYAEPTSPATAPGFARRGVRAVIDAPPPPLAKQVPDAPPELLAIVDKAMARTASDRYPSGRELAQELRRFEAGQLVAAHRYSPMQLLRRWARRHRTALVVAGIAALALLIVGAVSIARVIGAERVAEAERDTAVVERHRAEEARVAAETERNELRVLQGEQALARDPTEALDWIAIKDPLPAALHERAVKVARQATALGVAFARHHLPGRTVALVGAGDRVAAVSTGGAAAVWAADGKELTRLALGAPGSALALSADGAQLVVASEDGRARWYTAIGAQPRTLELKSPARLVTFIANDRVVLALADGAIQFWSASGESRWHPVHRDEPTALIVSGDSVISAGDDGSLARTRADGVVWTVTAHKGGVGSAMLDADGTIVLSAGADGAIRRWGTDDGRVLGAISIGPSLGLLARDGGDLLVTADQPATLHRFTHTTQEQHAQSLAFPSGALCSPCGAWRIVGAGPRMLLERAGDTKSLDGHRDKVTQVIVIGTTLVSADRIGEVRFWTPPAPVPTVAGQASSAPAATKTGWVVGLASGELIRVAASGERTAIDKVSGSILRVAAAAERDVIAAATGDRLYAFVDGKRVLDVRSEALRIAVSADGEHVSVLAEHGEVWSTRTGQRVVDVAEARSFVLVSAGHAYVAVAGGVITFDLADPPRGRGVLQRLAFEPNLGAVLPDGGLVVASTTGAVQLLERGAPGKTVDLGHQLLSLAFDRGWIIAGRGDGAIDRWRPADGTVLELRGGHPRWVHGLAGSPAAEHLASWSLSSPSVRIWRLRDDTLAFVPTLEPIFGAAFSPAGDTLLVTDRSGAIRMVRVDVDRLAGIAPGALGAYAHEHLRVDR
ncbi:MAG: protein kinase [Deltaproteobacteria bacterium]|nr:protein kinase [Deltaproteobacteria bacterium]